MHAQRVARLAEVIRSRDPQPGRPSPCAYLTDREARHLTILPQSCSPGFYHALMDLNFRRLGDVYYRPQCVGCHHCRMLRVPVAAFGPSRAQRRCLKRNADLSVVVGPPTSKGATFELYRRYLEVRHDGKMSGSRKSTRASCTRAP